ncbi:hypothetical protein M441DRAFT_444749 [Trichoderma asperellum CBS 433.97]|uniref:Uncharacterized protein n=1 Tax=Trichoderma asperellum (strain ATCC 204424 / CBS 433.97 / NBRC 101777) TaxID=1042311 RepID=A0A2T3ZN05_TRIA4|nr:hypothetical protein M441DRAFT_444749 [Trichoderma asperellum CBS 433.97]PTB46184.1 hypothetical protein M441DRAFT_444749 [Trichoderma asperellum CBS 433.97]
MLDSIKDAFHRGANRLFHRSDKRRPHHSTNLTQPSSKLRNPPQETSTLGTGTNADEQHTALISPLINYPHQPSGTLDAQPSSAIKNQAPFSDGKKTSASPQCSRNVVHDSKVGDAAYTPSSESHHRKPSLGKSDIKDEEAKAQSRDKPTNGRITVGPDTNNDGTGYHGHHGDYMDRSVDHRPVVTQQEVKPHIHTVYEPKRTRSIHLHEHRTLIQPIVDPAASTIRSV